MTGPAPIWLAPTEPRCLDNDPCPLRARCARALVDGPPGRSVLSGTLLLSIYSAAPCGQFLDAASHRKAPVVEKKVHDVNRGLA